MASPMTGYQLKACNGSNVLIPDSLRSNPKAGGRRVQATPRTRSADMQRLAKANGWSAAETRAKTDALIAQKRDGQIARADSTIAGDVYVPKTKAARTIKPAKATTGERNPLMADPIQQTHHAAMRVVAVEEVRAMSLRDRVREAVAAGIIAEDDAVAAGVRLS